MTHPIDSLAIYHTYPTRARYQQPHTESSGDSDKLCQSLSSLSQRLRCLSLDDIAVSDDIFSPNNTPSTLHWPRLEDIYIIYPPVSPTGEKLFQVKTTTSDDGGGDVDDDDDVGYYASDHSIDDSTQPHAEVIVTTPITNRFFAAAGRAALEMPALRDMKLEALFVPRADVWLKFRYTPGKAIWASSCGYVPDHGTLELWNQVSRQHVGSNLEVVISGEEDIY